MHHFMHHILCIILQSIEREVGIEMKDSDWFIPLCVRHYVKIYASAFMQTMVDRFLD